MTDLDQAVSLWGMAYGVRSRDDAPAKSSHQIARAMEHGARSRREYVVRELAGRSGISRRTAMARDLGGCGVRVVPMSGVDPVPCKDNSGRHRGLQADPLETPEVQRVQACWEALRAHDAHLAAVAAVAHQRPDLPTRADKAAALGISAAKYDQDLRCAMTWLRCGWAMGWVVDNTSPLDIVRTRA